MMLQALSSSENSLDQDSSVDTSVQENVQSVSRENVEAPQAIQDDSESKQQTTDDLPVEVDFIAAPTKGSDEVAAKQLADDPEMLEAYLDDALRCVASMEQAALAIEQDDTDREPVRQFLSLIHI